MRLQKLAGGRKSDVMFCDDMLPGDGLEGLVRYLEPVYVVPSRATVTACKGIMKRGMMS